MINPALLSSGSLLSMTIIFFLQLATTLWPFLYFTSIQVTGVGFPRLLLQIIGASYAVVFALLLSSLSGKFLDYSSVIFLCFPLFYTLYVYWRTKEDDDHRRSRWLRPIGGFLLFHVVLKSYMELSGVFFPLDNMVRLKEFMFLGSSMIFGVALYAMCLGHYYLVVPNLSPNYLLKVTKWLWGILILRFGICIVWYFVFSQNALMDTISLDIFHGIMISMGSMWGWIGTIVLAYFGQKLTKMNSIQSATGIYYIMVFFVIVGIMLSNYYFCKYKVLF